MIDLIDFLKPDKGVKWRNGRANDKFA